MTYKAITSIPGWAESVQNKDKVSNAVQADARVPLVFRAVRLRCNALTSIPFSIVRNGEDVDFPLPIQAGVKSISFRKLIWFTEAAMLITGASYWLNLRNNTRRMGVQWLNPLTVHPQYLDGELKFLQSARVADPDPLRTFSSDEIGYFCEFNLNDDVTPGTSAAEVALQDAQLLNYITRFAWRFFEGGAMPAILLGVVGDAIPADIQRVESFFSKRWSGIKNAFKVIGVRAGLKPEILTPPLKDMALAELKASAVDDIADAFDIPLAMIRDPNNRATAEVHRRSFYEDTVVPRALDMQESINQFLDGTGYTLEFRPNQMDIFQDDEANRAASLLDLTQALSLVETNQLPPDKFMVFLDSLGYDLSDKQREILLIETERPLTETVDPGTPKDNEESEKDEALRADMSKWRRKAMNRVKSGKSASCEFGSDTITDDQSIDILNQLSLCFSEAEVKAVFSEYSTDGHKAHIAA